MRIPFLVLVTLSMLSSCQNPSWNRQYIVLAAKDLKAGHCIEKTDVGMIMTAKLFAKHFPTDALHDGSQAVGHTLKRDIAKDSPILQSELQ
jgi:flagella basal body P-ring formation protein FlgA